MAKSFISKNIIYILLLVFIILLYVLLYFDNKKSLESYANSTCVIYNFHSNVGFFSNFFSLCELYIRAKKTGYDFYIDSSNWSYKYKNGWHDYFDSLTEINDDIRSKYSNIITGEHVSGALYEKSKNQLDTSPLELNDYSIAILEIFKPSASILEKVNKYNKDKYYDAVYIRRGDKITCSESKYISASDILKQINIKNNILYVQTDDYTEVEEIRKLLPEKKIETLTLESQRGANERDRDRFTPDEKKQNTEEFLTGVIICSNASSCWVDIMSNVSRFIKLYGKNVQFYKIADETINFDLKKQTVNPAHQESFM